MVSSTTVQVSFKRLLLLFPTYYDFDFPTSNHPSLVLHLSSSIPNDRREMGILNRNSFFRLMTALAFFSGMANAGDQTLLVYYVQEKLSFTAQDIAFLFLIVGAVGVLAQAVVLKPLNDLIGERHIIILCFLLSLIDNVMYGFARNKETVFLAIGIGGLSGMAFPTISAIKANNVVS
jgi:Na+/melibiose symporter-like transporter